MSGDLRKVGTAGWPRLDSCASGVASETLLSSRCRSGPVSGVETGELTGVRQRARLTTSSGRVAWGHDTDPDRRSSKSGATTIPNWKVLARHFPIRRSRHKSHGARLETYCHARESQLPEGIWHGGEERLEGHYETGTNAQIHLLMRIPSLLSTHSPTSARPFLCGCLLHRKSPQRGHRGHRESRRFRRRHQHFRFQIRGLSKAPR